MPALPVLTDPHSQPAPGPGAQTCILTLIIVLSALIPTAAWSQSSRAENWKEERVEKAESLVPEHPGVVEEVLLTIESSIDDGVLGVRIAGVSVYVLLLLFAFLLPVAIVLLMFYRYFRRRYPFKTKSS